MMTGFLYESRQEKCSGGYNYEEKYYYAIRCPFQFIIYHDVRMVFYIIRAGVITKPCRRSFISCLEFVRVFA